jgi:hypothetical protein
MKNKNKQKFEDEIEIEGEEDDKTKEDVPMPKDIISIKIKKSDNQIVKLVVNVKMETVIDLKERTFKKEKEEGKNIRLIYQGKVL